MKILLFTLSIILLFSSCYNKKQPDMETQNTMLIRQYFQHFNDHNWTKMAEMYTETSEFKDPTLGIGIVKQTRAEITKKYSELNKTFPDLKDEIVEFSPSKMEKSPKISPILIILKNKIRSLFYLNYQTSNQSKNRTI